LDREGYTVTAIAGIVGVSKQQVSYDLKRIRERHLKASIAERAAMVAEKLEELRDIRAQAWQAWEESLGHMADELVKKVLDRIKDEIERCSTLGDKIDLDALDGIRVEVAKKPNMESLRVILACIRQERELLALDSAKTTPVHASKLGWDALLRDMQCPSPERSTPREDHS
jgi:hypothetical protein